MERMGRSKPLARRRFRLINAKARSTTQRQVWTTMPVWSANFYHAEAEVTGVTTERL